jgi:hypothetical protein
MNEKIRELAEQAGPNTEEELNDDRTNIYVIDVEKFAELIVRECMDIVKPTSHHEVWAQSYLGGVDGLELLGSKVKKIKEHFGVEE